jgi:hypothetical protein
MNAIFSLQKYKKKLKYWQYKVFFVSLQFKE